MYVYTFMHPHTDAYMCLYPPICTACLSICLNTPGCRKEPDHLPDVQGTPSPTTHHTRLHSSSWATCKQVPLGTAAVLTPTRCELLSLQFSTSVNWFSCRRCSQAHFLPFHLAGSSPCSWSQGRHTEDNTRAKVRCERALTLNLPSFSQTECLDMANCRKDRMFGMGFAVALCTFST